MQYAVVGIFESYGEAEAAIRDLELAGITGEQVEVISDIDEDARTVNTPGERATKPRESHESWTARLFGRSGELANVDVRDTSGEQANYIGEQEFYASHVKQGGAVMIVRTPVKAPADRAAKILHAHGARTPSHKDGPAVREIR